MNATMRAYNRKLKDHTLYEYNCYGFATHNPDWLEMDISFPEDLYYNDTGCGDFEGEDGFCDLPPEDEEDYYEQGLRYAVEEFLYWNSGVREIESLEDVAADCDVIAMRVSEDDFHFARRMADGYWYHKPGCLPIKRVKEENFEDIWGWRYRSRTAWFEVKRIPEHTRSMGSMGSK